ncbi:MAG: hypothetical protein IJV15_10525 [Lachnospiraceae bacterium]|nr:hypothetical protein [Lachnospiraceae bacterium]
MILAIYGTSGAGKETLQIVIDILKVNPRRWSKIVFIDDTKDIGCFNDFEMMPFDIFKDKYSPEDTEIHIAIGNIYTKQLILEKISNLGYNTATLIHPSVIIGNNVTIGRGVSVKMGVVIEDNCTIGDQTWVQQYCIIKENTIINHMCQLSAKCIIGCNCNVSSYTFVGMHALVKSQIDIGKNVLIAMGTIVIKDIPDNAFCMGNPGRVLKIEKGQHKIFNS